VVLDAKYLAGDVGLYPRNDKRRQMSSKRISVAQTGPRNLHLACAKGGAKGIRTPDPHTARSGRRH
jgi:hypothetical protein